MLCVVSAHCDLHKVLFLALPVTFFVCLFVNQISWEPLNGFASNSHGWSLTVTSLKVKVKKVITDKSRVRPIRVKRPMSDVPIFSRKNADVQMPMSDSDSDVGRAKLCRRGGRRSMTAANDR